MNRTIGVIAAVLMALVSIMPAKAQETADIMQVARDGAKQVDQRQSGETDLEQARISVVTCYPGSRNYELYGHTMIRVKIADQDLLFNYGIFNFKASGFLYRFVKGECDYMLAAYPYEYLTKGYESRKIVEQELNLTAEQKRRVVGYLWWDLQPQNATYRYDWAYNNCATKPRDIIEMAVGSSLSYGEPADRAATFRSIMAYFDRNYPWQQFGIDLVLGMNLDHLLDYREQMFSPIKLKEALAGATIIKDGIRVPLVASTNNLIEGGEDGAALGPTPLLLTPMAVFTLLFVAVAVITFVEQRRRRLCRWLDSIVFGAFGLAGVLVAFLTFVSTHYGTSPNVNILWVHPLAFVPAVAVWVKSKSRVLLAYHYANAAIVVLLAALWWALPQVGNAAFIPLAAVSLLRSLNYILGVRRGFVANKKN